MIIENDTYAIIKHSGKPKLVYVLNGEGRQGVLDSSLASDSPVNITYVDQQALCPLGPEPKQGSVYGLQIEPYINTFNTKKYGPIHFFREMDERQLKALKYAMIDVYDLFKESLSVAFLPVNAIHIKNKRGRYAGSYRASSSAGLAKDTITFHPHDFSDEKYNQYLVAHEFAHGVWYRCVPHKIRAKWIKLYEKRMHLKAVSPKRLDELFEEIVNHETGLNGFMKEVADDFDLMLLKEVMGYLRRHYSLTKDNVQLLIEFDSESLGKIWPAVAHLTEKRFDISEYASTKVEEFFAEAVAYYVTGRNLPKDVVKALEVTIKYL
jgi:hypothetical protein